MGENSRITIADFHSRKMRRSYIPTIGLSLLAIAAGTWVFFTACSKNQVKSGLICISDQAGLTPSPRSSSVPPSSIARSPNSQSSQPVPSGRVESDLPADLAQRFSRGDRVLFRGDGSSDRDDGVSAFKKADYQKAILAFNRAVESSRNDPEPQIYLNNALARQKGTPYTLAVIVPVDNRADVAKEMLRGVADSQTRFNEASSKDGRLVEILIVNDANDSVVAGSVADQLAKMPEVLGVIGHNSSEATLEALPKYEQAGLAVISPTSTSTKLKGSTFFRTVPSDAASGQTLADYAATQAVKQVVIFFDSKSPYSQSLKEAFSSSFAEVGGKVVSSIDLSDPELEPKAAIEKLDSNIKTALLFPSIQTIPRAISIARANAAAGTRMRLMGGDSLYDSRTLINGGDAIANLVLAVPWFSEPDSDYGQKANIRWGGRINWRTASSFDAAQALIDTLAEPVSRQQVLQGLRSLKLPETETAGASLQFESTGDRMEDPLLVQAIEGGNRPEGAKFGFELISP